MTQDLELTMCSIKDRQDIAPMVCLPADLDGGGVWSCFYCFLIVMLATALCPSNLLEK